MRNVYLVAALMLGVQICGAGAQQLNDPHISIQELSDGLHQNIKMLAAASGLGTAQNVDSRAPTTSPPTCVSGRSDLFDTRRSDLLSRTINKEVFEDEPPLPAVQRPAAMIALNRPIPRLVIGLSTHQLVLRTTVWTVEQLRM
jgi:hypothetical protein